MLNWNKKKKKKKKNAPNKRKGNTRRQSKHTIIAVLYNLFWKSKKKSKTCERFLSLSFLFIVGLFTTFQTLFTYFVRTMAKRLVKLEKKWARHNERVTLSLCPNQFSYIQFVLHYYLPACLHAWLTGLLACFSLFSPLWSFYVSFDTNNETCITQMNEKTCTSTKIKIK